MKENEEVIGKIFLFCRTLGVAIIAMNIYYYCYGFMRSIDFYTGITDQLMLNFKNTGLFADPMVGKGLFFAFFGVSLLGEKGKKKKNINKRTQILYIIIGILILIVNTLFIHLNNPTVAFALYTGSIVLATVIFSVGILNLVNAKKKAKDMDDIFNEENETFPQETEKKENEYSINLETEFFYKGKKNTGWINVVNPFRATIVFGTPGSGKSFSIVNEFIRQHIRKDFTMYIYDFKFPDLSEIAYKNYILKKQKDKNYKMQFCVINFDDPAKSHRCNPLLPEQLTSINDAHEISETILLNLNRSWIQKQGDFFVESPKNFVSACLWFLKIYKNGKYCTFPHLIEFICLGYDEMFPILGAYPELENLVKPFVGAYLNGAAEQLEGQIASARIPLTKLESKEMYWIMTGNDFSLDINNPNAPKILCCGNNPQRANIYGVALALYNSRIMKICNQKKKHPLSLIVDELPTIFFRGIDQLIATGRSNKISTLLSLQDNSQLKRDYGDKEAVALVNTMGNLFSGQVLGETADSLSKRFGKSMQKSTSMTHSDSGTSISESTRLETLIPASKIAALSQGKFVGAVADNFGEESKLKTFNCEIKVDMDWVKKENSMKHEMPIIYNFKNQSGDDIKNQVIEKNYLKVKADIKEIVADEIDRIKNDPELAHLIMKK
ncbi:MAG: YWFCY domain-containing protein [Bacteroidales bacterium]